MSYLQLFTTNNEPIQNFVLAAKCFWQLLTLSVGGRSPYVVAQIIITKTINYSDQNIKENPLENLRKIMFYLEIEFHSISYISL